MACRLLRNFLQNDFELKPPHQSISIISRPPTFVSICCLINAHTIRPSIDTMRTSWGLVVSSLLSLVVAILAQDQRCGSQAGGKLCDGGLCCSQSGYCGSTPLHCSTGCQSQCGSTGIPIPSIGAWDITSLITKSLF